MMRRMLLRLWGRREGGGDGEVKVMLWDVNRDMLLGIACIAMMGYL